MSVKRQYGNITIYVCYLVNVYIFQSFNHSPLWLLAYCAWSFQGSPNHQTTLCYCQVYAHIEFPPTPAVPAVINKYTAHAVCWRCHQSRFLTRLLTCTLQTLHFFLSADEITFFFPFGFFQEWNELALLKAKSGNYLLSGSTSAFVLQLVSFLLN